MNLPSDENAAKRRKVRKGTHSCWQCRRRKVRCTFASPDDAACISCHRQGTECVSQSLEPTTTNKKTGHTEYAAVQFDHPVSGISGKAKSKLPNAASYAPSSGSPFSQTPKSTLHSSSVENVSSSTNNELSEKSPEMVMTAKLPPTPLSHPTIIEQPSTHLEVTAALLAALPFSKDLEILLDKIRFGMLPPFYQPGLDSCSSKPRETPRKNKPAPNLLHPESHPVLLARQMLLFGVALQNLSPNEVIPNLTEHHHVIMRKVADSAIRLVTTNDAFLSTLEGLDNIILEAKYHTDGGNIRRAWVTMRRAVMTAHLLGLHRPGHYRFKVLDHQNDLNPSLMWASITHMERTLSLLLGLPTSTGNTNSSAVQEFKKNPTQSYDQHTLIMTLITIMTGRIIERNQINTSQQALDMTREIDREFVLMAKKLPSAFWRPLALTDLQRDSAHATSEIRRAWDQICYYTLLNQLHLPYMMSPSHASQRTHSKVACVNASREILTRQIAVRALNLNIAYCRIGDFMALIAGMTLMLAHAMSYCHKETENLLVHQRLGDRATVERALECMQSMSELHEDALAAKCATLLKEVLAIEADAAEEDSFPTHDLQGTQSDHSNEHKVLIIKVPYVGVIRIARDGITSVPPLEADQDQGPLEDVTIGGIGSMHVKSPKLPDLRPGHNESGIGAPQEATTQVMGTSLSQQQDAAQSVQVPSGDMFLQQDPMFPDAAASMDDWILQGFDTAFFDILMRGVEESGGQLPNNIGGEGWESSAFL